MGNLFRIIGLLLASMLVSLGLLATGIPQDPVKKTENKRHIKMVKLVDGKKLELDTVLTDDKPFVWMGDTINGKGAFKIVKSQKGSRPATEESAAVYSYRVTDNKGGKNMVIISKEDKEPIIVEEFTGEGDSAKKIIIRKGISKSGSGKVMTWENKKGEAFDISVPPPPPVPPVPPVPFIMNHRSSNVIDLSDPGIISYKKKKLRDGNEKIEIIRKEPKEMDAVKVVAGHPIVTGVNSHVDVIGNGEVGTMKVEKLLKDGKVIRIEETETLDGKKEMKVNVTEEKEVPADKKK